MSSLEKAVRDRSGLRPWLRTALRGRAWEISIGTCRGRLQEVDCRVVDLHAYRDCGVAPGQQVRAYPLLRRIPKDGASLSQELMAVQRVMLSSEVLPLRIADERSSNRRVSYHRSWEDN